jgi:hypothetical protein
MQPVQLIDGSMVSSLGNLPQMPNPLGHCDQKDFGISEDYQEWVYIMPKKTGEI